MTATWELTKAGQAAHDELFNSAKHRHRGRRKKFFTTANWLADVTGVRVTGYECGGCHEQYWIGEVHKESPADGEATGFEHRGRSTA